jgi:hypothetical protein
MARIAAKGGAKGIRDEEDVSSRKPTIPNVPVSGEKQRVDECGEVIDVTMLVHRGQII